MKYTKIICIFLFFSSCIFCQYQPIPTALRSKAIYYPKTKQLNLYSCCYNVLFNAANFEHLCGFSNPVHRYSLFHKRVRPYLKSIGYNPKKTSTNSITEHLAKKILDLQPLIHLEIEQGPRSPIVPVLTKATRITYPQGTSRREIDRLLKQALNKRRKRFMTNIEDYLSTRSYSVVHFLCYVTSTSGGCHGILISLLQNETGRGLYIFDNLNEPLSPTKDSYKFIEYLCTTFKITKDSAFVGPNLPQVWPHLDGR